MPFGLVSTPSTFQRMMDEVLRGLHECSVAYLDDILIHSATWAEHVQHLTQVFDQLRSAGLRVKERKCSFAKNKYVYLGYVVVGGTIEPMECKVLAVQKFTQPHTKKQVRSFWVSVATTGNLYLNFSQLPAHYQTLLKRTCPSQLKGHHNVRKHLVS